MGLAWTKGFRKGSAEWLVGGLAPGVLPVAASDKNTCSSLLNQTSGISPIRRAILFSFQLKRYA